MYLLDTNHASSLLHSDDTVDGTKLIKRIAQYNNPRLCLPDIVVMELTKLYSDRYYKRKDYRYKSTALEHLLQLHTFTASFQVIHFDEASNSAYSVLREAYAQPKWKESKHDDLRIAAIAMVHGITLLTANVKDFQMIPGLKIENWLE